MRTIRALALLAVLALSNVGCIMVIDAKGFRDNGKRVVEIDDEFYLVDVKKQSLRRIEIESDVEVEKQDETKVDEVKP